MDAAMMEKVDELIDALSPEQDVSMMTDEEKMMYDAMDEEDKRMYSKMTDEDKEKYMGMDDENKKAYMSKMREDEEYMSKDDDEEEVEKGEDAESTASSDADERLMDLDEVQQENIDEVAKAITKAIGSGRTNGREVLVKIQKQLQAKVEKKRQADQNKTIAKTVQVMSLMAERLNNIEKAFENLTAAIGIKDEVVKSVKADRKEKITKSRADDGTSIGREIAKAIREELGDASQAPAEQVVQKAIRDDSKGFVEQWKQAFRSNPNVQQEMR